MVLGSLCHFPSVESPAEEAGFSWCKNQGSQERAALVTGSSGQSPRICEVWGLFPSSKVAASFFAYFNRFDVFPEIVLQISRMEKTHMFVDAYLLHAMLNKYKARTVQSQAQVALFYPHTPCS